MTPTYSGYSTDAETASFFVRTSATRLERDSRAKELVGGEVVPVKAQGVYSYTVYAGASLEYVVQFRLKSLKLKTNISTLARHIYGPLVPEITCKGHVGSETVVKEPLYVYLVIRIPGVTHLDFIVGDEHPESFERRKIFIVAPTKYANPVFGVLPG